jgi:16S rRNA (guanine1516-N2)-methyltransferase
MFERNAVVWALLSDALRRLAVTDVPLASRLHLTHTDASDVSTTLKVRDSHGAPEVVYIDPMYAPRTKSAKVNKGMQLLHSLLQSQQQADADNDARLLDAALTVAVRRVVVKRQLNAPALQHAHKRVSSTLKGTTQRFDIYARP